jgi:hypothetical protein
MSVEIAGLRDVRNVYGQRDLGYDVGVNKTEGASNELSVGLSGSMLGDIIDGAVVVADVVIPAGAVLEEAHLFVDEAFVLGGTTPAVEVGTKTSEATNGVTCTEAQLEAVGGYDVTAALSGTWASGSALAAATTVGVAVSGTSPTSTSAGKARLVVTYKYV